jgi:ElaB protein
MQIEQETQMSEDDKSAAASNVLNPTSSSSGSNAAAPSTFSPSTSSARSPDAAGATTSTPSTDTGSAEATEDAGQPKASDASSAVVGKEHATSGVGDKVAMVRDKLVDARNVVHDRYRVVSESTADFVHESPWKSVALAALAGLIVGMLAAR